VYTGFGTNSITSGDNPLGTGPSAITFNGASFSDVQPGEVFNVGTLSFHNGISNATTFIFGGILTLNISGTSVPVDPLTTKFYLLATAGDPNLPPPTPEENADLIQLNFLPGSGLYAFEEQTVTANLFGSIVGDPQLNITGIELAPGQEGNGFIGPAVSTPDTGTTLLLFASALMVIVSARYKLLARS
jgi:hypothetical protein